MTTRARTYVPARTPAQADYARYLHSFRWRLIRRLRLWLDGGRCRVCNGRDRLEVHHRSYQNKGKGFTAEVRDCITLCEACHHKAHGRD